MSELTNSDASLNYDPCGNVVGDTSGNPIMPELPLYQGTFYAFDASGGFHLAEGIAKVNLADQSSLELFDLTNCVQVMMDVRLFNQKLGVMKDTSSNTAVLDACNNWIFPYSTLQTSYDKKLQYFVDNSGQIDSISVSAQEFSTDISYGGNMAILSVGVLATLYDDFDDYVKQYFGYAGGFASLFDSAGTFEIGEGFNETKLFNLITDASGTGTWGVDASGNPAFNANNASGEFEYNAEIQGGITISNIVKSLRFAVDSNIFNNRHPQGLQGPIPNPVATYTVSVVDICANETFTDNRFYINDIQQPTIGLTESNTSDTYNYRFDVTNFDPTHVLAFSSQPDGAGTVLAAGATTLGVTVSNVITDGSSKYVEVSLGSDASNLLDAHPTVPSKKAFYYYCGIPHAGMGGMIVNEGPYDNSIADSSDPSGNAYIKSQISGVTDASFAYNFGVGDGFMANDLIFVREGIRMKVEVTIQAENYLPTNNIGPLNTTALTKSQASTFASFSTDASDNILLGGVPLPGIEGTFSLNDEVTRTSIQRNVQVPLVIRLANMNVGPNAKYTSILPNFSTVIPT
jgi:hypothetical protein